MLTGKPAVRGAMRVSSTVAASAGRRMFARAKASAGRRRAQKQVPDGDAHKKTDGDARKASAFFLPRTSKQRNDRPICCRSRHSEAAAIFVRTFGFWILNWAKKYSGIAVYAVIFILTKINDYLQTFKTFGFPRIKSTYEDSISSVPKTVFKSTVVMHGN